jgi:hypothetical protein
MVVRGVLEAATFQKKKLRVHTTSSISTPVPALSYTNTKVTWCQT